MDKGYVERLEILGWRIQMNWPRLRIGPQTLVHKSFIPTQINNIFPSKEGCFLSLAENNTCCFLVYILVWDLVLCTHRANTIHWNECDSTSISIR